MEIGQLEPKMSEMIISQATEIKMGQMDPKMSDMM